MKVRVVMSNINKHMRIHIVSPDRAPVLFPTKAHYIIDSSIEHWFRIVQHIVGRGKRGGHLAVEWLKIV